MLIVSATRIRPEGHIQLQHRVALTLPRIIKMTGIVYTGYFTTLLKEEIFDQEKQMFIVLPKTALILSISVLLKEFHLPESTEAYLQIVLLVELR